MSQQENRAWFQSPQDSVPQHSVYEIYPLSVRAQASGHAKDFHCLQHWKGFHFSISRRMGPIHHELFNNQQPP